MAVSPDGNLNSLPPSSSETPPCRVVDLSTNNLPNLPLAALFSDEFKRKLESHTRKDKFLKTKFRAIERQPEKKNAWGTLFAFADQIPPFLNMDELERALNKLKDIDIQSDRSDCILTFKNPARVLVFEKHEGLFQVRAITLAFLQEQYENIIQQSSYDQQDSIDHVSDSDLIVFFQKIVSEFYSGVMVHNAGSKSPVDFLSETTRQFSDGKLSRSEVLTTFLAWFRSVIINTKCGGQGRLIFLEGLVTTRDEIAILSCIYDGMTDKARFDLEAKVAENERRQAKNARRKNQKAKKQELKQRQTGMAKTATALDTSAENDNNAESEPAADITCASTGYNKESAFEFHQEDKLDVSGCRATAEFELPAVVPGAEAGTVTANSSNCDLDAPEPGPGDANADSGQSKLHASLSLNETNSAQENVLEPAVNPVATNLGLLQSEALCDGSEEPVVE